MIATLTLLTSPALLAFHSHDNEGEFTIFLIFSLINFVIYIFLDEVFSKVIILFLFFIFSHNQNKDYLIETPLRWKQFLKNLNSELNLIYKAFFRIIKFLELNYSMILLLKAKKFLRILKFLICLNNLLNIKKNRFENYLKIYTILKQNEILEDQKII